MSKNVKYLIKFGNNFGIFWCVWHALDAPVAFGLAACNRMNEWRLGGLGANQTLSACERGKREATSGQEGESHRVFRFLMKFSRLISLRRTKSPMPTSSCVAMLAAWLPLVATWLPGYLATSLSSRRALSTWRSRSSTGCQAACTSTAAAATHTHTLASRRWLHPLRHSLEVVTSFPFGKINNLKRSTRFS